MSIAFVHCFQAGGSVRLLPVQAALLRQGISLRTHHDVQSLCGALREPGSSGVPRLALLAAAPVSSFRAARALRGAGARVAVVALLPGISDDLLSQALRSGIDACWPDRASAAWLAAAVLRLAGAPSRNEPSSMPCEGGWSLTSRAWVVASPDGGRVVLTTAERALMLALCRAPARRLPHAEILRAIDAVADGASPHSDEADHRQRPASTGSRRLSVLMSRLRRKFAASGLDMPVRSLRGIGYELCVDLRHVLTPADAGRPRAESGIAASRSRSAQAAAAAPAMATAPDDAP